MARLAGTEKKGKKQVDFFICTKTQALDNMI